jgi:biopolymer transport protein ExbB/TolQ
MHLEWFASDLVLSLGMIGTIVGFMIMLYGTFGEIDVTDMESVRNVLSAMSSGLYTALSTTLLGLISSVILKCQISIIDPEDR